jgi:tripartite-type tricarboxylate transporter receptor subunit TctC
VTFFFSLGAGNDTGRLAMTGVLIRVAIGMAGLAAVAGASASAAAAADGVSFAGKTITMTIGNAAGSGTDLYGRVLGRHLVQHLPGHPSLVVLNQPGAGGLVAYNSWVKKAKPDGLSVAIGGLTELDPGSLLRKHAEYDPATFKYVGGLAAPSQALFINKDALARLHDTSAAPVVMGAVGESIRGGYFQALWGVEFLGWNVRWVHAYRDTSELRQAMERGEADMSSFGSVRDIENLLKGGKFSIVSQSGTVKDGKVEPRPELGNAPIFAGLVRGHIKDPLAQRAYDYGENVSHVGRWLALPPATPDAIVAAYLRAYETTVHDPEYNAAVAKTDPGSPQVSKADLERLARELSKVSPEVIDYVQNELKRQGFIHK